MKLSRRTLLQSSAAAAVTTTLSVTGCANTPFNAEKKPASAASASALAEQLLGQATDLMLNAYPETASSAGIDKGNYAALRSRLTDRSVEGQAAIESNVRAMHASLAAIDTTELAPDQALNVEVVKAVFSSATEGFDFPFGDMALLNYNWSYRNSPYAVAQNTGAFVEIPSFLDGSHAIENAGDAQSYLERMEAYANQLEGETERTRLAGERGVILPDFLMAKTLDQLRGARTRNPAEWGIVTSLATRVTSLGNQYTDHAAMIAEDKIGPAIDRQIAVLETLAPRANADAGIWAKPDGDAYYAWALRAGTTTDLSPNEVHEIGLEQLATLQGRMDPILRSIGYTSGSVGDRMTALAKDKRYHFSQGDKGRTEIIDFIHATLDDIRERVPSAFNTLVPGFLEVTRIAPEVEAGAPGAYGGAGSIDGTKPGHFWINLRTPDLHNKFTLADLTYHEAIPGHVWQGEYTFKQPLIRSLLAFNAYSEGWALYAEQLADELGVYDEFEVGRLGYLQSLSFRACRLVVDTGLHAKRWTRQQAINWFVENNGSNPDEVQSEVDRYCAWPGQACGYKIGHSEINRLRERTKLALGEDFDVRGFNDALLLGGAVPMSVLGKVIDNFIAREQAT